MKILIAGANGRMGKELRALISASEDLDFAGGFDRKERSHAKIFSSLEQLNGDGDVLIDFSLPEAFSQILKWCVEEKIPLVSGTTGLSEVQHKDIKDAAKKIPILWASNMSPGVQVVKNLLKNLQLLPEFDIQMTEYHHIHKKDKPSGTAISLQKVLEQKRADIPAPLSIRGGGIFGIHRIELMAPEETITIEHQALSRAVFARGALSVARWLVKQPAGLYTMDDFLP